MAKNFIYAVCALALLAFVSCESKDGDWEFMKWEVNTPNKNKNHIDVPISGSTYVFKCKNYDGFWLYSITENDITRNVDNEQSVMGEWFSIDIEKIL